MEQYIAFIPVRGGSKSIPLKNIKMIHGRPLVYWTLDAAVQCDKIGKVYVYTDSEKIKECVYQYMEMYSCDTKLICANRPAETATDTASTESAMIAFAEECKDFSNMILIQATSPLLTTEDLNSGIDLLENENYDSVISVVSQRRFQWKFENGNAEPVNYDINNRPRRQEFSGYFVENGAFYINSRKSILRDSCRLSGRIGMLEMNEDSFVEIDEPSDWIMVEELLKKHFPQNKQNPMEQRISKIKMLLTDCDGVLTDAGMYYSETGEELKKFSAKDGMGVKLLHEAGIKFGIITGENSQAVKRRAEKLNAEECYLGISNKLEILDEICARYQLSYDEIAYIGDDCNDIGVLCTVGFPCSVADGMEEVRQHAVYVTKLPGGYGALREVVELILNTKRKEDSI